MNNSEILIYQNSEGSIKIDVRVEEESVWLTQAYVLRSDVRYSRTIVFVVQELLSCRCPPNGGRMHTVRRTHAHRTVCMRTAFDGRRIKVVLEVVKGLLHASSAIVY